MVSGDSITKHINRRKLCSVSQRRQLIIPPVDWKSRMFVMSTNNFEKITKTQRI